MDDASTASSSAASDRTVGDVLRQKTAAGEIPPFVVVQTHQHVRDAITLLHEHRVSQLPVVIADDPYTVVGSVGERGLLKAAMGDPAIMAAPIIDVMEAPFPVVSTVDPVREAVELLTGESQALIVSEHGRPVGIVTRTDLLESLVAMSARARCGGSFATRGASHAGLEPDPTYGVVVPAIHQSLDLRAARAGRVRRGLRLLALGQSDAQRAGARAGGARRRARVGLLDRHGGQHALITAVCNAGDHVVIPDDLYGGTYRLVDKVLSRWGLEYTMVDQTDLDAVKRALAEVLRRAVDDRVGAELERALVDRRRERVVDRDERVAARARPSPAMSTTFSVGFVGVSTHIELRLVADRGARPRRGRSGRPCRSRGPSAPAPCRRAGRCRRRGRRGSRCGRPPLQTAVISACVAAMPEENAVAVPALQLAERVLERASGSGWRCARSRSPRRTRPAPAAGTSRSGGSPGRRCRTSGRAPARRGRRGWRSGVASRSLIRPATRAGRRG